MLVSSIYFRKFVQLIMNLMSLKMLYWIPGVIRDTSYLVCCFIFKMTRNQIQNCTSYSILFNWSIGIMKKFIVRLNTIMVESKYIMISADGISNKFYKCNQISNDRCDLHSTMLVTPDPSEKVVFL